MPEVDFLRFRIDARDGAVQALRTRPGFMAAYADLITEILGEERGVLRQGDRGSNVAGDGPGRST